MYVEYHLDWSTFQLKATQKIQSSKKAKVQTGFLLGKTDAKQGSNYHISEKNPQTFPC